MTTTTPPVLADTPLKRALDERGLKQRWLVERTGIAAPELSRIVRGLRPTPADALAIAETLDMQVSDLWEVQDAA